MPLSSAVQNSSDALGCQQTIASRLVEAGADYVLTLKDNQPILHDDVRLYLDTATAQARLPVHETVEKDHGRIEIRHYALGNALDWLTPTPA